MATNGSQCRVYFIFFTFFRVISKSRTGAVFKLRLWLRNTDYNIYSTVTNSYKYGTAPGNVRVPTMV